MFLLDGVVVARRRVLALMHAISILVLGVAALAIFVNNAFAGGGTWTGPGAGKGDKVFARMLLDSKKDPYELFSEVINRPGTEGGITPESAHFDSTLQSDKEFLENRVPNFAEEMFEAFNGSTDWYVMDINSDEFKATEAGKRILAEQRRILSERGLEAASDNDIEFYALQDEDGIIIDSQWLARVMAKPEAERLQLLSDMARHEALRFKKIREDMAARAVSEIPPANAHCYVPGADGSVRKVVTEGALAQIEGLIAEKSLDAERLKDRLSRACFSPTKSLFEVNTDLARDRKLADQNVLLPIETYCLDGKLNFMEKQLILGSGTSYSSSNEVAIAVRHLLGLINDRTRDLMLEGLSLSNPSLDYSTMYQRGDEIRRGVDYTQFTAERICGSIEAAREFLGVVRGNVGITPPDSIQALLADRCSVAAAESQQVGDATSANYEKWRNLIQQKGSAFRTELLADPKFSNMMIDRQRIVDEYMFNGFDGLFRALGYDYRDYIESSGTTTHIVTCAEVESLFGSQNIEECQDGKPHRDSPHPSDSPIQYPSNLTFKDDFNPANDFYFSNWRQGLPDNLNYDIYSDQTTSAGSNGYSVYSRLFDCIKQGYLNPVPTGLQPAAGQLSDREGAKSPLDVILGTGSVVDPYMDPAKILPAR